MMTRLRRWFHPEQEPAPPTDLRIQRFRDARREAFTQTRASRRVQRALQDVAEPGLDYSTLNRQTFGRLPREERP